MSDAIERICVIGAGTMGHGIAQVAAQAGYQVVLNDVDSTALDRARDRVAANLEGGIRRGKLQAADRDAALARLSTDSDLSRAAAGAHLIIEAIVEQLAVKQKVLNAAAESAPKLARIASNTSSLSIAEIASTLPHPERVAGMHFFNPVHIMKLVEVVVHPGTDAATREAILSVARRMQKEPIVVRDSPGFASSRLGVILGLEAMRMVEQGVASAADIDKAMELGYRHPMGPLKLTDLVGLDVRLGIAEYLHGALGAEHFRPPALLRRMVEEGRLGRKSGQGFYEWKDGAR